MANQSASQSASRTASQAINLAEQNKQNLKLAQDAAECDVSARKQVNDLISPIIHCQTNRFCKRFCKENRLRFKCTLSSAVGSTPADASLCEWGNGSYAWMLNDLSSSNRLKKYQANNNATLFDYCYVIANSLPFYERWKDWRFGRKVYVPSYIQALGKKAVTVFYALRLQQPIEQISQQTSLSIEQTRELSRNIIKLLTRKNKLFLLKPAQIISISQEDAEDRAQSTLEAETATYDEPVETREESLLLSKAWAKLNPVEQFVIEALVIEEQDADVVLNSLRKLAISFKTGVAAEDLDRQQLYYFRRKTLAKLQGLLARAE
ncbi:MAG: hypothetical protein DRQ44_07355 [Gammaproteobacteria bacterium]|nr:MAG: hypothetical protein DRQ44_07355 [Gammaproteobacteria bacterium]